MLEEKVDIFGNISGVSPTNLTKQHSVIFTLLFLKQIKKKRELNTVHTWHQHASRVIRSQEDVLRSGVNGPTDTLN